MKYAATAAMLVLLAIAPVGCGAEPAADLARPGAAGHEAGPGTTGVPHDPVSTSPSTAFERIRDGIPGKGAEGAQAAWSAGLPVFLVFAASW